MTLFFGALLVLSTSETAPAIPEQRCESAVHSGIALLEIEAARLHKRVRYGKIMPDGPAIAVSREEYERNAVIACTSDLKAGGPTRRPSGPLPPGTYTAGF